MTDNLAQEIAGLKAVAQGYAARHQRIENLSWPAGKRIAVNFTADFDAMLLRRLNNEPPMQLAKGEFGGRVGIWRLIELFDQHAIKATIFTVGRICELYPQGAEGRRQKGTSLPTTCGSTASEGARRGARSPAPNGRGACRVQRPPPRRLAQPSHADAAARGRLYLQLPRRGRSPALLRAGRQRPALSARAAVPLRDRRCHVLQLRLVRLANGEQRLSDTDRVFDMWWAGFMQQYRQGGYLNVCLHPFVSGRALRVAMLDRLITRMKTLPGVWFATCEEVARHCLDKHPPHTVRRERIVSKVSAEL